MSEETGEELVDGARKNRRAEHDAEVARQMRANLLKRKARQRARREDEPSRG